MQRIIELGVNIDHVATLRQAREEKYPDPVTAACLVELGGASQITVHLREDRRHIQERDVQILRETVATRLNLEMAATTEMVKIALSIKPYSVTFVPERREELTTEGGLEVTLNKDHLRKSMSLLKDAGIRTYLFIDPDLDQVKASHQIDAHGVEFHTGRYCNAKDAKTSTLELSRITDAVRLAEKMQFNIAAGHGLNYVNVIPICRIKGVGELNIGHSIVARAVYVGLEAAVREMVRLINLPLSDPGSA